MSIELLGFTKSLAAGQDLGRADIARLFDALIAESDEQVIVDVLRLWNAKGHTAEELHALAEIVRKQSFAVNSKHKTFVDIVGTGGSKTKGFNVSTAAAFVIAGAGLPVAKHGNRAASSKSGSADVLSELGVNFVGNPLLAEKSLREIGVCFMFAPNHLRLSQTLANARRNLGLPTIFNNLGPLCNPAKAPFQIVGVWDERLVELTASALSRLGTTHSWIVHGSDGLDEITLSGKTLVGSVRGGEINMFEITPEDFGIEARSLNGFAGATPGESAVIIRSILDGSCKNSEAVDLVKLNAAAALYVADFANTLPEAFNLAAKSLESGSASAKLRQLKALTNESNGGRL
ncbi:MAG: anthranilate phosphoribosyltransferase [Pyrinomonadaceae bacterium]